MIGGDGVLCRETESGRGVGEVKKQQQKAGGRSVGRSRGVLTSCRAAACRFYSCYRSEREGEEREGLGGAAVRVYTPPTSRLLVRGWIYLQEEK